MKAFSSAFWVRGLLGASLLLACGCGFNKVPKHAYSEQGCPAAPDYADLDSWAAHPAKQDMADLSPRPDVKDGQSEAQVDVFFVHPTTLWGTQDWNGDLRDAKLNARTDRTTIKHQASIFNGVGRVYAPRYRQMILGGFFSKEDPQSASAAFHIAYADVKAAFEHYLAHENGGRPIVIAAHSQGTAHAIHLLRDFFDGQQLQERLVAAYIPGWPVPQDTFRTIAPCGAADQNGCFVSWCSYEWGTQPKSPDWYAEATCVNPITWRLDTLAAPISAHKGIVMGGYDAITPEKVSAKVDGHILWVTRPKVKGAGIIRSNNFHIADYNLFWLDVRENAALRAKAFLQGED